MLLAGNCRSPAWAWQLSLVDLGNKFGCWSAENGRSARTENSFDLKSCRKFLLLTFRDLQSWGISFPLSLSMSLPHTYTRRVRRATFVQLSRRGESQQIYLGGAATTNISILISSCFLVGSAQQPTDHQAVPSFFAMEAAPGSEPCAEPCAAEGTVSARPRRVARMCSWRCYTSSLGLVYTLW